MTSAHEILQVLTGLPLSIVRSAANMRGFHFGPIRPHHRRRGTAGAYVLHVQCPWRLVGPDGVITGSADFGEPPRPGAALDLEDPRGGSLQNLRLAAFMGDYDAVTRSHVNRIGTHVVIAIAADPTGRADIGFGSGISLQLFPDGSSSEDWRFFPSGDGSQHFVIEGGRVFAERDEALRS